MTGVTREGVTNPVERMSKYPYMFSQENSGFDFAIGWFPGFFALCENIDRILGPDQQGFHWTQIKEKLGRARYKWSLKSKRRPPGARGNVFGQIMELVRAEEDATTVKCIYCGVPGSIHNHNGYLLVRCERHREFADVGMPESHWFQ